MSQDVLGSIDESAHPLAQRFLTETESEWGLISHCSVSVTVTSMSLSACVSLMSADTCLITPSHRPVRGPQRARGENALPRDCISQDLPIKVPVKVASRE